MSSDGGLMRYSADHLWLRRDGDGVTLGIAEQISRILTWVNEVRLPKPGACLAPGDELATIESQKASIELPAPVGLAIVAINEALESNPMLVRLDPRGRGWLARVELADGSWERLLDETAYRRALEETDDEPERSR